MNNQIPKLRMRDVAKIYDKLDIGIIIADREGIVIWGNKSYSKLAGFDIRIYFGKNIRDISLKENVKLPQSETMIDIVHRTYKELTEVVRYDTSDYVITRATPIFDDCGEISFILYSISNYSEMMRLQNSLTQSMAKATALEAHLQDIQLDSIINNKIVVVDERMRKIYRQAMYVANTPISIMITGESGVGKDALAKFIHQNSIRKKNNFIHVNMGAIPKSLFESELFGYEPGSFTGALKTGKTGLIQLADKGTIYLDEIGDLPLEIQSKLLHVVQEKEVRSIGSVDAIPIDIRIISATNCNLEKMIKEGSFRLDLYYRLNVIEIEVPPLRERLDDITALALHFLDQFNKQYEFQKIFDPLVLQQFQKYPWPGNVRELQHVIERLVSLSQNDIITLEQLPDEFHEHKMHSFINDSEKIYDQNLNKTLDALEKHLIIHALKVNPTAECAAKKLGINASTLSRKRKKYGI